MLSIGNKLKSNLFFIFIINCNTIFLRGKSYGSLSWSKSKICRALGDILQGLTNKTLEKPYRPGQHGQNRMSKPSDYKERLIEKQKLRYHFGLLEKQFQRYVSEAVRRKGPTGENLISLLESRLDNVVWRLGLAPTIPAARQYVVHGHITVDGKSRQTFLPSKP